MRARIVLTSVAPREHLRDDARLRLPDGQDRALAVGARGHAGVGRAVGDRRGLLLLRRLPDARLEVRPVEPDDGDGALRLRDPALLAVAEQLLLARDAEEDLLVAAP